MDTRLDSRWLQVRDSLQKRCLEELFRWGGKEFLIIAPQTGNAKAVVAFAENIRVEIENVEFATRVKVSASFGDAKFQENVSSKQSFEWVNKVLRRAKRFWRNRVDRDAGSQ